MERIAPIAAALIFGLTGCTPSETEERQPPAEELQSFEPGDPGGTEADRLLNAPGPVVESAVEEAALQVEEGEATFYADVLEGRRTASGTTFSQSEMVAAHRAFPFGTRLRVTNLNNDRDVEVRVVDRGPFGGTSDFSPAVDLSQAAAGELGFLDDGRARVRIEVLEWGP